MDPSSQHQRFRTAVKWKNLNPEFNEEFIFDVKRNELPKKTLDVRVYDKDVGRTDDFIGKKIIENYLNNLSQHFRSFICYTSKY